MSCFSVCRVQSLLVNFIVMTDEDEWKKLPTDQKCQHKAWKARAEGYKECIKHFGLWDEGSPEFSKYLGLVKKFVTDPNELVRIQGVEAVKIFVENANVAKKTCGEVVSGIISKCFSTKPRLKESAIDVCLMYIEIDRNEQTMEELLKGFSSKQPKVATACIEASTKALSVFGSKVIQVKPMVKEIPGLADHRDKNVREAAKSMAIEIYRWVGPAIKSTLQNLNPVMLKELEEEWEKINSASKPAQSRFMRSQQDLKEKMEAKAAAAATSGENDASGQQAEEEQEAIDPYDLLDPVEILSKLPKTFFEQIEAKKWQERKEMLEICQKLCETPKIEPGDFGDLVKALKKVISKDTNVMLVTIAAKCLAGLAKGIRRKFQPFAVACIDAILEKFKEKKPMVIAALQDAADAIYLTTTPQALSETCLEYLASKNPSIREQTGLFLVRGFSKTKPSALNKTTAKPYVKTLLVNIDHGTPGVREAAFQALGMLLKICGDKLVMPFLADIDNLKLEKIKEYGGKAQVTAKAEPAAAAKSSKPASQAKSQGKSDASAASSGKPKPSDMKKKVVKGGGKKADTKKPAETTKPVEPVLSDVAVEEQIAAFLPAEVIAQLTNANWKERLEGLQAVTQKLKLSDVKTIPCQAIVKTLGSGKPGWKDTNFNCLNEKFGIVKNLAETAEFSKTSAEVCIPGLIEKIGDVKCGKASKEALTAIAEATEFPWVTEILLETGLAHKNPKIQAESLSWLATAIEEFGINGSNIKLLIAKIKVGFAATNPSVRSSAFNVLRIMAIFIGAKIRMFFENEKPALLQQIDAEIEKCSGQAPPAPTRGVKTKNQAVSSDAEGDDAAPVEVDMEDLVSRVNIADKISDSLITKLADKNWKMRKEALDEVTTILNEAKFVEPTIGELAIALKKRLGDSNKILIVTSLTILSQLAVALGRNCKVHVKTVAPGIVEVLADSKPNVRQAALNAMNQWLEYTNLSLWFEDEIMSSALSVPKHTFLRSELLNWLAEKLLATPKLTAIAKEGLEGCVKHLYACCEDRNADVRAKAQAAMPAFIYHLGMDKMMRMCGKLGASSINTIQGLLEKSKELVPARKSKPLQKPKTNQPKVEIDIEFPSKSDQEETKPVASVPEAKTKTSKPSKLSKKAPTSKKTVEEPESGPALIHINNGKEQRMKDEQKLKTLKWVFDSPRDDLVSQLKSQCSPCIGTALFTELFHADFQRHIKAIVMLSQALEQQWNETVGTMDLILRWVTLRFYDKNTSVHLKALEYLKTLFEKLTSIDYRMTEYEAGAFIPHLLTKIGEPKENIRKDIHTICHQITRVYPASKMFNHLMQGLVTKNSRQKTECLDELGTLITSSGVSVCQPSPAKALKEIATHIGDRDNSVRSAALNVIVCAYNTCGETVYKFVGKLNEKDMSMLEERIKRSGKFNADTGPSAPAKTMTKGLKPPSQKIDKPKIAIAESHAPLAAKEPSATKFDESEYKMPDLLPTDMAEEFLKEPDIEMPPKFITNLAEYRSRQSNAVVNVILNRITSTLANADMDECLKSGHQLDEIMKRTDKRDLLKPRVDLILTSSSIQLRMVMNRYMPDYSASSGSSAESGDADHELLKVESLCKCILAINYSLWKSPDLAICASQNPIHDYVHALSKLMLDKRIQALPNAKRLVAIMNLIIDEVFKNANSTFLICGMIRMLNSLLTESDTEHTNLAFRCVWRLCDSMPSCISPPAGSLRPPLKPEQVFTEIHKTFESCSSRSSHDSELVATVVKTMRSLTFSICKPLGIRVYDEIENIDGIQGSELLGFITKSLKKDYSAAEIDAHPVKQRLTMPGFEKKENLANGEMSPEQKLNLIVKKVGDSELTKQGLQELYDFKQQYPDHDVDSKFNNMTPLF